MATQEVRVLVNLPPTLSDGLHHSLVNAHPRAEVTLVDDPACFGELLPRADAAMVLPGTAPLLPPALTPGGRLRWLHSITSGAEAMLIPEVMAAEHVTITASKGPMWPLVAEHALMLMLALARGLPTFVQNQAERRWQVPAGERPLLNLFEKTVLILGVGGIGGHLARTCRVSLGMRVLGTARTRRDNPDVERYIDPADLHTALSEADFVVLCLALTEETRGIIDAAALTAMKSSAYLINVARGGLVDEAALIAALHAGQIAGAGLDVTAVEPLPEENRLWTMPNVIITPHVAPGRDRAFGQTVAFMSENIRRFAEGEPLLGIIDRYARY